MRFIVDKPRPAGFNMAADMYLLNRCADGGGVAVRFYSWARPTVTVGYMQPAGDELDLEALRADGAGWIRRATGGRAVLHGGDATYCCAFHKGVEAMGNGITQTYRIIASCLAEGLRRASIKCEAHGVSGGVEGVGREVKLPCFLAPNRDEIMVGGRKLIGSAQKRGAAAVMQHGSIPISGDYRKMPRYLNIGESEKRKQEELLMQKSCCVEEIVSGVDFDRLVQCLIEGFSSTLPFKSELMPWSQQEEEEIWGMAGSEEFKTYTSLPSPRKTRRFWATASRRNRACRLQGPANLALPPTAPWQSGFAGIGGVRPPPRFRSAGRCARSLSWGKARSCSAARERGRCPR
ncbi:MAG: hypothetical protein LBH93_01945 [Chitinispirillales bacterium]|nr:hypothetical protein [Chitinispirillales bacterium]